MCAAVRGGVLVGIISCSGTNSTLFVGTSFGRTNSVTLFLVFTMVRCFESLKYMLLLWEHSLVPVKTQVAAPASTNSQRLTAKPAREELSIVYARTGPVGTLNDLQGNQLEKSCLLFVRIQDRSELSTTYSETSSRRVVCYLCVHRTRRD